MEEDKLSIFWISVDRIDPNPYQPRKEFSNIAIENLSQSIRRYGVLQPLVVTKKEAVMDSGDMSARYELIAGERRLRASKMAGLDKVPAVIRSDIVDDNVRLELAIIENLQREDLNPIDRAKAFKRLIDEFTMTHSEVAIRVGRSREYISNSLRVLLLPEDMIRAVVECKISEGHTRSLLMLSDHKDMQRSLFDEMINRKITVRDSEIIARRHATERIRKKHADPYIKRMEERMEGALDARVHIQSQGENGGKIVIDYFSENNLKEILKLFENKETEKVSEPNENREEIDKEIKEEIKEDTTDDSQEDDMYNFKNFSL